MASEAEVGASGDGWYKIRKEILERDGYTCQYCQFESESRMGLNVHHIHPVSKGGSDDSDNLVTLCVRCHKAVHRYGEGERLPPSVLDQLDELKPRGAVVPWEYVPPEMEAILDVLEEGRVTPYYLKERTGLNGQEIDYALNKLIAAGWVEKVTKALYELNEDPRDE